MCQQFFDRPDLRGSGYLTRAAWLIGVLAQVLALSQSAQGQTPAATPQLNVPLSNESLNSFSGVVKDMVLQKLPPSPVFEQYRHWGHQADVPALQGAKIVKTPRNHGNWQHIKATCPDLARNLELRLYDLRVLNGEMVTVKMHLALPTDVEFQHQVWQNGLLVFNGHGRARLRIMADLNLESEIKLDTKGHLLPDVVIRFKIADAKVAYDKLVVEHLGVVGGEAARVIGDTLHRAVQRWKPSLERDLLDKARAAILKAGETREVHLSLAKLIQAKGSLPSSPK